MRSFWAAFLRITGGSASEAVDLHLAEAVLVAEGSKAVASEGAGHWGIRYDYGWI